jgi:hypothetical protein
VKWRDSGAVRGVCRRWRAVHDAGCKTLQVRDGGVQSLTAHGLSTVGGLTSLTTLNLYNCWHVTDMALQDLTSLTSLTTLNLQLCSTSEAGRDALKAAIRPHHPPELMSRRRVRAAPHLPTRPLFNAIVSPPSSV